MYFKTLQYFLAVGSGQDLNLSVTKQIRFTNVIVEDSSDEPLTTTR